MTPCLAHCLAQITRFTRCSRLLVAIEHRPVAYAKIHSVSFVMNFVLQEAIHQMRSAEATRLVRLAVFETGVQSLVGRS